MRSRISDFIPNQTNVASGKLQGQRDHTPDRASHAEYNHSNVGMVDPNANGLNLLQFAMERNLSLACTWFTARDERYRMTWQSHRSKEWHCIDHILIPPKWLRVVRKALAFQFADGLVKKMRSPSNN